METEEIAEVAKALSEPARLPIGNTSNAIGIRYRPRQIVNDTQAEAKATIIRARTDSVVRTMHRLFEEEVRKQTNIENALDKTFPLLSEAANPSAIDDDWIDWIINFFEHCRNVSDGTMQQVWAKVLAQEPNWNNFTPLRGYYNGE
jgi:hypothetical protein